MGALPQFRPARLRAYDRTAAERIRASFSLSVEPESRLSAPMTAPSLLVTARQDGVVGYEDQLRLLAHYERMAVVVADRAGHNVHIDRPEVVRAAMTDWIDRMVCERGAAEQVMRPTHGADRPKGT